MKATQSQRVSQHCKQFQGSPRIYLPHLGKHDFDTNRYYGGYATVVGASVQVIDGVQHLRAIVQDDDGNQYLLHWDDVKIFFERDTSGSPF